MSALGQKQTCAAHQAMSALPPIATAKSRHPQKVMSSLPPKADMCGAAKDVRFTPNSDRKSGHRATSDEHSSARQNNPDFGELAWLRMDLD